MSKWIKKTVIFLLSMSLISIFIVIAILWTYSNKLPDYKFLKNYKPPVSSKLYSGGGELVSDFSSEKRIFVPYETIPKIVINSFLSAEDKNFFSHPGVDAKGIMRAIVKNISNVISSKRLEGASTITQQVAKNFLLTNEVSINRKIREFFGGLLPLELTDAALLREKYGDTFDNEKERDQLIKNSVISIKSEKDKHEKGISFEENMEETLMLHTKKLIKNKREKKKKEFQKKQNNTNCNYDPTNNRFIFGWILIRKRKKKH